MGTERRRSLGTERRRSMGPERRRSLGTERRRSLGTEKRRSIGYREEGVRVMATGKQRRRGTQEGAKKDITQRHLSGDLASSLRPPASHHPQ